MRSTPIRARRPAEDGEAAAGMPPAEMSDADRSDFRRRLLAHFDVHARDLPWRRDRDPYAVWVSEIMLQQTRVDTVIPYFRSWMARFPGVSALADASLDEVLKAWEGLGYYRRARLLHRAAGMVRDRYSGSLPSSYDELSALPGIGPYTAGAIASLAFDRVEPAVDGNVRRVLARLLDLPEPSSRLLDAVARRLVDVDRPGAFNEAMMELGATLCTPRSPSCESCPVAVHCRAHAAGTVRDRPLRRRRKELRSVRIAVAVVVREGEDGWRAAVVRRPGEGLLAGLWEFPGLELDTALDPEIEPGLDSELDPELERGHGASLPEADLVATATGVAAEGAAQGLGLDLSGGAGSEGETMRPVEQLYTHLRAEYHPVLFRMAMRKPEDEPGPDQEELRWVDEADLDALALPKAQRRIAEQLVVRMERSYIRRRPA